MFDVREKPKMVQRAFLVGILHPDESEEHAESLLLELKELVSTLGIGIVGQRIVRLRKPQARYLLGRGKVEEITSWLEEANADCLVFDAELSPAQQRNWEAATRVCVIDRQEVILDIFSERAQTREAVLQVDLARSEHSLPRLKNAWTHLSRQRGGGSVVQRGEGEAQIELDQRMVRQRIARLKEELATVVKQRHTQRKQRRRIPVPTAAIVGYTNAGKSTLLNQLTGATVLSEDKLFATLDPTTRQLRLQSGQKLLLTDTVGFVRRLPHQLVEAFKATLEEALVADFLIHIVDASSPEVTEHQETTLGVLKELGAGDKPIITVYNKVDMLDDVRSFEYRQGNNKILCSAQTGEGIPEVLHALEQALENQVESRELLIPHDRYDLIHRLHQNGAIKREDVRDEGVHIIGNIPPRLQSLVEPFVV